VSSARKAGMAGVMIAALGVVFGDLGTSPLYALPAAFSTGHHAVQPTEAGVHGVISLVFWTITLVVSVKYVTFIMRADNDGEGGIMALISLVQSAPLRTRRTAATLVSLGLLGASLFYGDGVITPAISVLSAIEGLNVAAPSLSSLVVPIALVVLAVLFGIQRFGTGRVGLLFGPVMSLWFGAIALVGLGEVVKHPGILRALSPSYGLSFIVDRPGVAFIALGAVVLAVTGAEALYADMGHFGRRPIRRAWFLIVFPALTLNYMGQGALILHSPKAIDSPFFLLIPHWARIPMVLLATAATVIASQAVISGAFSLTHQAVQLGFLPRLTIRHTSAREAGQVYAPAVNWILFVAVVGLVVGFGSSAHLASAYGIAVTGTMAITTILFFSIVQSRWNRPVWLAITGAAVFLTVDLALFASTLAKVTHGGWFALTVALAAVTILTTWRAGREIVARKRIEEEGPLQDFVEEVRAARGTVHRVPGTAVFLHGNRETTPLALRANVDHNHVLHESVVIVTIETLNVPHVHPSKRVSVDDLGYRDDGITNLTVRYGFHDRQEVARAVARAARDGPETRIDVDRASFFLSRITIVLTRARNMPMWRKRLFIALSRNEADLIQYFALPDERTVTMGYLIEL
jgi:KUP system potassium uptake protein